MTVVIRSSKYQTRRPMKSVHLVSHPDRGRKLMYLQVSYHGKFDLDIFCYAVGSNYKMCSLFNAVKLNSHLLCVHTGI